MPITSLLETIGKTSSDTPIVDELPNSVSIKTGELIPESEGLQTNNPGFPGFSSHGFGLFTSASESKYENFIQFNHSTRILTACGAETDSSGYSDYDASILNLDVEFNDQSSSDMFTINPGHYGQRIVLSGIAEVPVLGFQETNTVGLALVELTNDNGILSARIKTCETKIQRPDDIVTTSIPEAFIESLPIAYRSGFIDNTVIELSQLIELNGVRLNDPLMDALPDDTNDGIYDQDGDGFPGVTVFVSGLISGQINLN